MMRLAIKESGLTTTEFVERFRSGEIAVDADRIKASK
jgi:hypothetical protein